MVGREGRITNGLSDHSSLECKNLGEHPEASPIRLGGTTRCSVIPGRDPGSINPAEWGWQSAVNLVPQIYPFIILYLDKLDLPLSGPLFDTLFVVQS